MAHQSTRTSAAPNATREWVEQQLLASDLAGLRRLTSSVHRKYPTEDRDIVLEAWSPLKAGEIIDDPDLQAIANAHGATVPQVVLRWLLQRGIVAIPKSVTPSRIAQNADLYGFELSPAEIASINVMDRGDRVGPDADNFNF